MGALGASDRRLLPDRREPLPGHGDHPAPRQGHQTGPEPVIRAGNEKRADLHGSVFVGKRKCRKE